MVREGGPRSAADAWYVPLPTDFWDASHEAFVAELATYSIDVR